MGGNHPVLGSETAGTLLYIANQLTLCLYYDIYEHLLQPGHQRPDPVEMRRKYEQDLKEQMDAKRRVDEEIKRKEKEEERKLERRLKEQQEKMKREFEEEMSRKKAKEEAVSIQKYDLCLEAVTKSNLIKSIFRFCTKNMFR